jgi:hypothetical protein
MKLVIKTTMLCLASAAIASAATYWVTRDSCSSGMTALINEIEYENRINRALGDANVYRGLSDGNVAGARARLRIMIVGNLQVVKDIATGPLTPQSFKDHAAELEKEFPPGG